LRTSWWRLLTRDQSSRRASLRAPRAALQRDGEGNVDAVQWLPKHSQVLVINTDDASLYLVHADGTQKNDLPFEVDDVSPSPDGKNLLFVRRVFDSSGSYYRSAISRANLNTGQTQQLTQRR
jgi:Tol biopolymer transport system component